jgi:carbonic anhydrase/acetyltransferase-like protein (isoleucine patch superfamily)
MLVRYSVVVAPNSYVPAGSRLPENTLWAGNPVAFVKSLEPFGQRIQEKAETVRVELPEGQAA